MKRKACLLVYLSRTAYGYRPCREDDSKLRQRLKELAAQRRRFGSPRLHILLKRERLVINHKHTERIYTEEGLALRMKRRRKGAAGIRIPIAAPGRPNQKWSMDFVTDSLVTGRMFRALTFVVIILVNALRSRSTHLSEAGEWLAFWSGSGRGVVCLRSLQWITDPNSQAKLSTNGLTEEVSN